MPGMSGAASEPDKIVEPIEREEVEDGGEEVEEEEEGGEAEVEEEGDDDGTGEQETNTSLNSKQKKKKKSKAAAKLRKKLGLSSKDVDANDKAKNIQSASILSDEEVAQLQKAIEKEQGPKAASKADRATLEKLMKMMNLEKTALLKDQEAKQKQHKAIADHKFWKTQPVTKPGEHATAANVEVDRS
jgi:glycylpeptide N-tetradecanoyltransferase